MLYIILGQGIIDLIPISILEKITEDLTLRGFLIILVIYLVNRNYKSEEKIEKITEDYEKKLKEERDRVDKCKDEMREKEIAFLREMIRGGKKMEE